MRISDWSSDVCSSDLVGDWKNPYTTMAFAAEAQIVREIGKFLMNGGLFQGSKPVMWSVEEKTALAEAEVEYHDHASTTISVKFPVVAPSRPELACVSVVLWRSDERRVGKESFSKCGSR